MRIQLASHVPLLLAAALLASACDRSRDAEPVDSTSQSQPAQTGEVTLEHSGPPVMGGVAEGAFASAPPVRLGSRDVAATPGMSKTAQSASQANVEFDSRALADDPSNWMQTGMIIRTARATIEVDSMESALAAVQQLALRYGGYVANASVTSGKEQARSATVEVKLPSSRFDDALAGLQSLGTRQTLDVGSQDVSEEYVDISARVSNARQLEGRLIDLLNRRTGRLQEMLEVERELSRVRGEIERYEGRLRYLKARASVSSLTLTLHEPPPILDVPGESPVGDAFRRAWRNFVRVVAAFISALGVIVPFGVLLGLGWLGVRRLARAVERRERWTAGKSRAERAPERKEEDVEETAERDEPAASR